MSAKRYSEEEKQRAIELYESGLGFWKVAKEFGCYPSTVKKWVEKAGVQKHSQNKHSDELKQKAVEYYKTHDHSITDVGYIFGIAKSTLEKWIYEAGIAKGRFQFDHDKILEDLKTMSGTDVAVKYGCSESLVSMIKNGKL